MSRLFLNFFQVFSNLFPEPESLSFLAHKGFSLICVPYSTTLFRLCQHFLTNFFGYFALYRLFAYSVPGVFAFASRFYTIYWGRFSFSLPFSICSLFNRLWVEMWSGPSSQRKAFSLRGPKQKEMHLGFNAVQSITNIKITTRVVGRLPFQKRKIHPKISFLYNSIG